MSAHAVDVKAFLSGLKPFTALPAEDVARLAASARVKSYRKGETLYTESERADGVWVLHSGRIQIFKFTSQGESLALESLASGELFGTLCRLGSGDRSYPCTAVAAAPTTAIWLPERLFLDCYAKHPGFLSGLCSLCSERLRDMQGLRCLGQEAVPVRLAAILCRLHQVHGPVVPFTKKELAELVGAAVETVFRVISKFEKNGLLESSHGKIHIKNVKKLQEAAENG